MSTRYFTNVLIAVLGGALVVFTQSLSTGAVTWTGFGVAIGVLVVSLLAQLDSHRGVAQRATRRGDVGSRRYLDRVHRRSI